MVSIKYLCECPDDFGIAARWLYDAFVHKNRPSLSFDDFSAFFRNCGKDALPIRLVAHLDGVCAGTVSIVDNDLSTRSYTPWLGGLYVDESCRNMGIGRELIERVKQIVKDMEYREVYLITNTAGPYYQKLGWELVEMCADEFGKTVEVYRYEIG